MMSDGAMLPRLVHAKTSLVMRIALVVLSIAVFGWGLHYKLSLYKTESHPNPVSVAKLIQAENKKAVVLHMQSGYPRFLLQRMPEVFEFPIVVRSDRPVDTHLPASIWCLPLLFYRPPPKTA
jgi:hypothetical protein